MSKTESTATQACGYGSSGSIDPDQDPHTVFRELIREDRTICDTCFRRVREVEPAPPARYFHSQIDRRNRHSTETLKDIVTDRTTLGTGGDYCYPPPKSDPDDPYRERPSYGTIVCEACGHIDNLGDIGFGAGLTDKRDDATLTHATLRQALIRCMDRAEEAGNPVKRPVAFAITEQLKTTPEYAHRDADIVATALTVAVRRGHHTADADPPTDHDVGAGTDADVDVPTTSSVAD